MVIYSFHDQQLTGLYSRSQLLKQEVNQQLLQAVVEIEVTRQDGEQVKGTGFNIAAEGQIITNYHVLKNARKVLVSFPDHKLYNGINWNGDPDYDLALIKLNSSDLPYVPTCQALPNPGEKVIIVGNPLYLKQIAVEGTVGPSYQIADHTGETMSIYASIYQGNSGSPVYNSQGQVVAIIFATLNQDSEENEEQEQIIGLAVPISYFYQRF
ncbi:MAG: serine protease [Clostridia bacterium]|nr:serine protease [Clostridia bacterium]